VPPDVEERIPIESDADVVTARQRARELAARLELSSTTYASRGEVVLSVVHDNGGRDGIRVIARDNGPGIENIERALQDGFTSGGGLGLGLPGARRLVDEFEIQSAPNEGTTVTLVKWSRAR
jgi:serine/threonine-protein kinase RsbT